MIEAARTVQRNTLMALDKALKREQMELRQALEAHSSMPNNYWQERHQLQRKAQAINAIVEILEETNADDQQ
jgi:hypothetical protein